MRVLVLESDLGAADVAVADLEGAGHRALQCRDGGDEAFPCRGFPGEAGCPLDQPGGTDVALTVRAHPYARPTAFEDGVACALRRHVPLVVAGALTPNPFERWTAATASPAAPAAVSAACDAARRTPVADLSAAATEEARRFLSRRGLATDDVSVEVHRRHGSLLATVYRPPDGADADQAVGVRILGAIRKLDRDSAGIDVVVQERPS